jgi:hypothetical protein
MSTEIGKHSDYTITITPTMNRGFIVRIGCGEFAFQNHKALLTGLRKYLDDPKKYEKLYNSKLRQLHSSNQAEAIGSTGLRVTVGSAATVPISSMYEAMQRQTVERSQLNQAEAVQSDLPSNEDMYP